MAERRKLRDELPGSPDARIHSEAAHPGTPEAAHELTDARTGPLFKFLAGLGVLLAATLVATGALMGRYLDREDRREPARHPLASLRESPPEPRLQTMWAVDDAAGRDAEPHEQSERSGLERLEGADLGFSQTGWAEHRARTAELLSTYGWIDAQTGVVRVPIERAIELTLEEGLPVAPGAGASSDPGGARQESR